MNVSLKKKRNADSLIMSTTTNYRTNIVIELMNAIFCLYISTNPSSIFM